MTPVHQTPSMNALRNVHDGLSRASPKRKRAEVDTTESSKGSRMRINTDYATEAAANTPITEPHSPRTRVSNQLQSLQLDRVDIDLGVPILSFKGNNGGSNDGLDKTCYNASTPLLSIEKEMDGSTDLSAFGALRPSSPPMLDLTAPSAPVIDPTRSPLSAPREISPLPRPAPESGVHGLGDSRRLSRHNKSTGSRSTKSPPPSGLSRSHSDLFWTAAEITGYDPTDPADDGYGIKKWTAAVAYARSQRRKQQVAEGKTREAKEARQKRLDRRKGIEERSSDHQAKVEQSPRRVRFAEK